MSTNIDALVDQIVIMIFEKKLSSRKQYYFTQALLNLARAAHLEGFDEGRRDTLREITNIIKETTLENNESFFRNVEKISKPIH